MGGLNFVYLIKEISLMKCNTFYDNQCCTYCFNSEGTKITERFSYALTTVVLNEIQQQRWQKLGVAKQVNKAM